MTELSETILVCVAIFLATAILILPLDCEGMAPLGYGSYVNTYPRGRCDPGSFRRKRCMVGNCNLDSSVTNKQFCYIDCAQLSDPDSRKKCMKECMETMKYCR